MTGEAPIFWVNYKDKYVKMEGFALYGGWKIYERFFVVIVSCPKVDPLESPKLQGWSLFCASS